MVIHFDFVIFLHKLGPLIRNDGPAIFLGITSWEFGCDDANSPVVASWIESYLDWIKYNLESFDNNYS